MIPQRIIIEGFLCYRMAQEIDLRGLPLCMLAGPNGSGKSTVFDAITFALFGIHRGGARNVEDLINKKCDWAAVTFEFLLDGGSWQIYRTIRANLRGPKSTWEVRRPCINGDTEGWEVVPDTSSVAGLNNWVASKLAMNGEMFTRSMLLRQGESDRLLSAKPKERFEVLAGIAELEKYQELEASAIGRRNRTQDEVEKLISQLGAILPVSDEELNQAAKETESARERLDTADELIVSLQERAANARQWADFTARLDQANQKRRGAEDLVKNAKQIEANFQQLTALAAALPHLSNIYAQRQSLAQSKARAAALTEQLNQKLELLNAANASAKTSQENCAAVEPMIPQLESQHADLAQRIAESHRALDAAEATEAQRKSLDEAVDRIAKIVKKHPRPDLELAQGRQEAERLAALAAALPTLERFIESRRNGIDAAKRHGDAEAERRKSTTDAEAAGNQHDAAEREARAADAARQEAQKRETEIQTLLNHAKAAMADLEKAGGKSQCPTCGQPLTESHRSDERKRRKAEVARLTGEMTVAAATRQTSELRVKDLRRCCATLEKRRQDLAAQIQDLTNTCTQAESEIARSMRECRKAYLALPADLGTQISHTPLDSWDKTTWPAANDFDRLTHEAKQRAAAAELVKTLDQICSDWKSQTTQAQTLRQALSAHQVAIPENLGSLRAAHAQVVEEQKDVQTRLKDARESLRREQQALKVLEGKIKSLDGEIAKLTSQCEVELAHQANHDAAIRHAMAHLTADWNDPLSDLSDDYLKRLKAQADDLERRGIRQSFKDLGEVRGTLAAIDERIAELQADISRIPEPARQSPESIALQLENARAGRAAQEAARQLTQTRRDALQNARRQRLELETSQRQADRRLRHLKLLSELLGKKRLQLFLVRQAERKIVDCANGILFKLSSGDLHLQLRSDDGQDAEQALDLVAINQSTGGGQPIAVAFLSGSQRFRVAVSLALAIGQIAGNNRCGECVIIDEGFGSLDREGQDVMIQELHRLQTIMKRIILVSHQESFADAFPHGYRFSIQDGEARAERMNG